MIEKITEFYENHEDELCIGVGIALFALGFISTRIACHNAYTKGYKDGISYTCMHVTKEIIKRI